MGNDSGTHLMLGLARVGHLLVERVLTKDDKGKEKEGIELQIPDYQRPYKWGQKNVLQLLDDIKLAQESKKENYRVGTLILHHDTRSDAYNIVDGQQRIVSFCLMLRGLGEGNVYDPMLKDNPFNLNNVRNNYDALKRRIEALDERERKDLLDFVKDHCEFVVVITDNESEAFQFFDSQNARGKKLYPHDLLKAFHLREMRNVAEAETEQIITRWEDLDQARLAGLFGEYLYRTIEWMKGNRAYELNENNIYKFKGVTQHDTTPYAQFYKSAYSYAEMTNNSAVPFVMGIRQISPFQLGTPIVAGKPFFEYAKHYFDLLDDIQNNDPYEGYFINGNDIVKTLDLPRYKHGVGNRIARLLFDAAALVYVDRFCPTVPTQAQIELFEKFVKLDFIWAYSLRAQYKNLGWLSAENYIHGTGNRQPVNSFNLFKLISEADTSMSLINELTERLKPLSEGAVKASKKGLGEKDDKNVQLNYLQYFIDYRYYTPKS